jgi:hypothetical protein
MVRAAVVVRRCRARRRLHAHWAETTARLSLREPHAHDVATWAVVAITLACTAPPAALAGGLAVALAAGSARRDRGRPGTPPPTGPPAGQQSNPAGLLAIPLVTSSIPPLPPPPSNGARPQPDTTDQSGGDPR